jgi:heme-degrading monooxygenase HmoA
MSTSTDGGHTDPLDAPFIHSRVTRRGGNMEAVRLVQFAITPGRQEEAVQQMKERLIPRMEATEGFSVGYWSVDDAGQGVAFTVWDSAEARAAFGTHMKDAMEASGAITGTTIRDLPLVTTARAAKHA